MRVILWLLFSVGRKCPGCPLCQPQEQEVVYLSIVPNWMILVNVKGGVGRRVDIPLSRRSERWAYVRSAN